jgi:UDP-glucose 4-epimerase
VAWLAARIATSFRAPIDALELGCGTGRYFSALKGARSIVGIDASADMLALAQKPYRAESITAERITLIQGDIFTHPLDDASFDLVYSIGVLAEHAPFNSEIAVRVHRALKPEGRFAFSTVHPDSSSIAASLGRTVARALAPFLPSPLRRPVRARLMSGGMYADETRIRKCCRRSLSSNRSSDSCRRHTFTACASPGSGWRNERSESRPGARRPRFHRRERQPAVGGSGPGRDGVSRSLAPHAATTRSLTAAGVRVVEGNVGDSSFMAAVSSEPRPDREPRGESGAVRSMEAPIDDLDGNCRANLVVLDAIRRHQPGAKLVFVGSRLQYGRPSALPVNEDHPRDALCVHAVHKNTIEDYLRVYAQLFGLRYSVARVTNPYGPGQPASRVAYGVVNRMIHLALANQALPIYGDGTQQRDLRLRRRHRGRADSARRQRCGRWPRLQRRLRHRHCAGGHGQDDHRRGGGGRIEHVAWPRLAEQIETGDFVADVSRIRHEIGWAPNTSLADGSNEPWPFSAPTRCCDVRHRVVYMSHAFMVGGAEEMVLNLVKHLPERFEPVILCLNTAGPIGEEIRKTGVEFHVLGVTPGWRKPWQLIDIERALTSLRADIVTHSC